MKLNLTALEKAIKRLQEALAYAHSELAKNDIKLFQQFRNSVIQCFEFTYEICWKMIERRLSMELPTPAMNGKLGFNELLRDAAQYGLIEDPKPWMEYRKATNLTSHTYNEALAKEVYEVASTFFDNAQALLKKLQEKNQ